MKLTLDSNTMGDIPSLPRTEYGNDEMRRTSPHQDRDIRNRVTSKSLPSHFSRRQTNLESIMGLRHLELFKMNHNNYLINLGKYNLFPKN